MNIALHVKERLGLRRVVLGIAGSIAAYKAAEIVRMLRECDAEVRVVMTPAATAFIAPLTLQALSNNPVQSDLLDPHSEQAMGHIELARWADVVLIAPASADFIARLAIGRSNDLLAAVCLVTQAPIVLAPAMNQSMWSHPATQKNCSVLQQRGMLLSGPAIGDQACGEYGPGRLIEVEAIMEATAQLFATRLLTNKRVVITAGPTREYIDAVRYLSNRSSGKMGFALAAAAVDAGANTLLIAGPVDVPSPARVTRLNVESAREMEALCMQQAPQCDIFISVAAVADYMPDKKSAHKIKKSDAQMTLTLVRTPDILAQVAALPQPPFTVGFAAETENLEKNARQKIADKKLNMIAVNSVNNDEIGFASDDNEVTLLWHGGQEFMPRTSKSQLARLMIERIAQHYGTE